MCTGAGRSTSVPTLSGSDDNGWSGRRPRALTEARREQNRLNQRRYRQKQREQRREGLERRSTNASTQILELRPRPTNHGEKVTSKRDTPPNRLVGPNLIENQGVIRVPLNHVAIQEVESLLPLDFDFQHITDFESGTELLDDPPVDTAVEAYNDDNYMCFNELDIPVNHGSGSEALLQGTSLSEKVVSAPRLPSPRLNCLQFYQTTFFMATLYNARSMGFILDEENVTVSHCLRSSPYYRPVTPADDPKDLLAAITRPSTPAHLRPTLAQVIYPHPAFMDLIPIPAFRERAIALAVTRPQAFNLWDLKKDMVQGEGLVPWSNIGTASRSARMSGGQGQPWDIRSWEAAPWFLRKWRMLVDGEEGELWNQSLWWQRARGVIEG
ncbi:hypothetical protein V492_08528 [Pseudogymnoascus sp. VKM F-4246]|nr:hypothetical protein V492_08528 [Pseudogymnoascus sp. VKM F-4246]